MFMSVEFPFRAVSHWRRTFSLDEHNVCKDNSELCFALGGSSATDSPAQMASWSQPLGQIDALYVPAVSGQAIWMFGPRGGRHGNRLGRNKTIAGASDSDSPVSFGYYIVRSTEY